MDVALSQNQLEAFSEITRLGSFTKAAEFLGLTQSALSHRIRHLEEELETSVFIRIGNKVRLTEAGTRLLQFYQVQSQAEEEFLAEVKPRKGHASVLSGRLRIGGASSIMRYLILPAVGEIIRKNPEVRLEFFVREVSELPNLISSGQVDFLISTAKINLPGLDEVFLGYEENVLVQTSEKITVPDVFLDHDQEDQTTFDFLKVQGYKDSRIARSFLDDVYSLRDAVTEGIGKAALPMHLISGHKGLGIVPGFKPLLVAVHIYQFKQPYYTRLHQHAFEKIKLHVSKNLRKN